MPSFSWSALADKALAGEIVTREEARAVLHAPPDDALALLDAAFRVRRHYWGRRVSLHVLENAKMGACPEDCGFCSQSSKHSAIPQGASPLAPPAEPSPLRSSPSGELPMKSVDDLVAAARVAHAAR